METYGSTRVSVRQNIGTRTPTLTVEVVLYVFLAVSTLFIHLLALDFAPLAPSEALQALASFDFVNGRAVDSTTSPLLFSLNSILFFLTGAQDVTVRIFPAMFGSGLVLVPVLIRHEMGRLGSLFAASLLAFSPTLVFFSRSGNGSIVAVTCACAALAFGWRYLNSRVPRDLNLGAVAGALALLAAREVWTVIAAAAIFALLWRVMPRESRVPISQRRGTTSSDAISGLKSELVRAGILAVAVFVGVGTILLTYRGGVGAAMNLFGAWLGGFVPGGSPFDPLRVLIVYEPVVLFFGFAGCLEIGSALVRKESVQQPLLVAAIWSILAFLLYSIGADKDPARLVAIVVPLALLAGWFIASWLERLLDLFAARNESPSLMLWQEFPVFLFACAIAAFLYFVLAEFTLRGSVMAADLVAALIRTSPNPDLNGFVLTLLIAIAIAVVAFLAVTSLGWDRAKDVATAVAVALLTLWGIRQMSLVSFSGVWNPQDWLVSESTSPNVRDLVSDLEDLSRWRANDSHTLVVLAENSLGPVARWYLRSFPNTRFEEHPTMLPGIHALLLSPDTPINAGKLMSQNYRLDSTRAAPLPASQFLQWLLFRQGGMPRYRQAVLWVPQPGE